MEVISWVPESPNGQHEPAARGKFFNDLMSVKVFWDNPKGYFEVTFTGNKYITLPEHFDTLQAAKKYAEKQALLMLQAAILVS